MYSSNNYLIYFLCSIVLLKLTFYICRGKFENRHVAVKRLSPKSFIAGENEVRILLEADYHPNIVQYYCTEQYKNFRYIAFELYAATIQVS